MNTLKFSLQHISKMQAENKAVMKLTPGDSYTVIITPVPQLDFIEIEDTLFRHGSAVFLPGIIEESPGGTAGQNNLTGVLMIKAILMRAFSHPEQKVLIAGHTDRSGDDQTNDIVSQKRARAVMYSIIAKRDEWVEIADSTSKVEDKQHYLKWVSIVSVPECDPGPLDGKFGPKTENATRIFQKHSGLKDDGIFGKKTWGAVFDVLQNEISKNMQKDDTEKQALLNRNSMRWVFPDNPAVGCGERWPIENAESDGLKSQTNRRVEILFFDENELPDCNCSSGMCSKETCRVYPDGLWKRCYIGIDGDAIGNMEVSLENGGAGVSIKIEGPETRTGITDDSGKVTFKNLKVGTYSVSTV